MILILAKNGINPEILGYFTDEVLVNKYLNAYKKHYPEIAEDFNIHEMWEENTINPNMDNKKEDGSSLYDILELV